MKGTIMTSRAGALLASVFALTLNVPTALASRDVNPNLTSGPPIGGEAPAFDPQHVTGPDRGTHACPMCKYGNRTVVLIWVNADAMDGVAAIAARMEREIGARGPSRLKAFVVAMNPGSRSVKEIEATLTSFARQASLDQVALTYVPGPRDPKSSALYAINPDPLVRSTVLVTRNRRVTAKFVNPGADAGSLDRLAASVDAASSRAGGE
jgi:protocatechuate 3,4-dioxygenase beta subunit